MMFDFRNKIQNVRENPVAYLNGVIKTEEASSVDDNSDNRDGESLVKTGNTISLVDLSHAVANTVELSLRSTLEKILSSESEISRTFPTSAPSRVRAKSRG